MQPERLSGFYKKHEEGSHLAAFFHAFGELKRQIPGSGAEPQVIEINATEF
jgi:hypothetical protein